MANLKQTDKIKLEKIFGMESGHVIDFSNRSFYYFVFDILKIDIQDPKYLRLGESKANRLRNIWSIEPDYNVGMLTKEMLEYWKTKKEVNEIPITESEKNLLKSCITISNSLLGIESNENGNNDELDEDSFLRKEFKNISLDSLNIDKSVVPILNQRIIEIQINIANKSALSAVIMCGSVLEGILLGIATSRMKEFNQSSTSPKNRENGKVLPFHEWSLSNFIDTAHNLGLIGLDVKKFSHSLREFRNYIHPYQQMSSNFSINIDTAKISWQVVQAAISDLHNK